uniref:Uncharacterized protein n=1 Tax=viral metagenome TaxID=1070528 RepID=A0A2V0RBQ9_9ZZZZ
MEKVDISKSSKEVKGARLHSAVHITAALKKLGIELTDKPQTIRLREGKVLKINGSGVSIQAVKRVFNADILKRMFEDKMDAYLKEGKHVPGLELLFVVRTHRHPTHMIEHVRNNMVKDGFLIDGLEYADVFQQLMLYAPTYMSDNPDNSCPYLFHHGNGDVAKNWYENTVTSTETVTSDDDSWTYDPLSMEALEIEEEQAEEQHDKHVRMLEYYGDMEDSALIPTRKESFMQLHEWKSTKKATPEETATPPPVKCGHTVVQSWRDILGMDIIVNKRMFKIGDDKFALQCARNNFLPEEEAFVDMKLNKLVTVVNVINVRSQPKSSKFVDVVYLIDEIRSYNTDVIDCIAVRGQSGDVISRGIDATMCLLNVLRQGY